MPTHQEPSAVSSETLNTYWICTTENTHRAPWCAIHGQVYENKIHSVSSMLYVHSFIHILKGCNLLDMCGEHWWKLGCTWTHSALLRDSGGPSPVHRKHALWNRHLWPLYHPAGCVCVGGCSDFSVWMLRLSHLWDTKTLCQAMLSSAASIF